MLWLAGLMGLMAVGTFAFIDPQNTADDGTADAGPAPEAGDMLAQAGDVTATSAPLDFTAFRAGAAPDTVMDGETFYDPRGGDDAADLGPLILSPEDMILLTEGSDGDDVIEGADGNDRIAAGAGADVVTGGNGNDELRGQDGNDTLSGNAGEDTLHGEDGTDTLSGGEANDDLIGHNANDVLFGDDGNDLLTGSAGDDLLDGGSGDDVLHGGLDDDTLQGGTGADTLFGGWGNDLLNGAMRGADGADTDAADFLNGGGGDDTLLAGRCDIVTAGTGADRIVLGDWISGGDATDLIDFAPEEDSLLLVWDDSDPEAEEPLIEIYGDPDDAGRDLVLMDGEVVARIAGTGLAPEDLSLIPLSSAVTLGLAPES
ncbi:calcium-binding protein [Sulfitobacter sp. HNIBRBA3233]|uniref:calcium-binding protein n=1 Tax=Sulfitobacter marinivivus TaxID=3158558 RepID=UPI0032DE53B9